MLVGERMSHPVITVPPEMPIQEALSLFRSEHIRRAPVVKGGKMIGIVSESDLLNASPSSATTLSVWELNYLLSKITVEKVMRKDVLTVDSDCPIEEAARIMADNKVGGLPVMDGKKVVGIITETDLFKIFLELMGAREKGVQDGGANVSLASLLMGLGIVDETRVSDAGLRCPACGFTQGDFKKAGRLGCSTCWQVFEAGLQPLLKAMHKGERHVGKVPKKAAQTVAISEKIKALTAELDQAVRAERYEEAAQLRDQVRALEAELKVGGR